MPIIGKIERGVAVNRFDSILANSEGMTVAPEDLAAKGLTGVHGFLLGSVAQRIAQHANPSVLIGRPPKK